MYIHYAARRARKQSFNTFTEGKLYTDTGQMLGCLKNDFKKNSELVGPTELYLSEASLTASEDEITASCAGIFAAIAMIQIWWARSNNDDLAPLFCYAAFNTYYQYNFP